MGLKSKLGTLPKGKKNSLCDVPGVRVGHKTLNKGKIQTGVTAIIPAEGSLFKNKVEAGVSILNGFGKSVGLMQVEELGTLETPIVMTNTLSVGIALSALTKYMLWQNEEIGETTGTVNCLVTECNDSRINDIRGLHVKEEDVLFALNNTDENVEEGAVGAGRGMVCFGLKGGIGSSSRILSFEGNEYSVGALVLSNFGGPGQLRLDGNKIISNSSAGSKGDKGSIIMILATDLPLSSRQLKRLANRCAISLGRTGSIMGHGSGDIALAFSTAQRIAHSPEGIFEKKTYLYEEHIEKVFVAGIEAVEEAIYSSLYHAETMVDRKGKTVHSLKEYWNE